MEVMRVVGVIPTMAAAVAGTLLEAAVTHQAVGSIRREVVGIRLEVAVIPCRQRSLAGVGLEVHLYRRARRDMMSALRQTSPI